MVGVDRSTGLCCLLYILLPKRFTYAQSDPLMMELYSEIKLELYMRKYFFWQNNLAFCWTGQLSGKPVTWSTKALTLSVGGRITVQPVSSLTRLDMTQEENILFVCSELPPTVSVLWPILKLALTWFLSNQWSASDCSKDSSLFLRRSSRSPQRQNSALMLMNATMGKVVRNEPVHNIKKHFSKDI